MKSANTDDKTGYRAFICYSHRDEAWARWLHKALESYRVPRHLVGQCTAVGAIPRRLTPIFRDRDELPSAADLSSEVSSALAKSASLIVICSPAAAASRWVNEEISTFKRVGGERILCLIIEGEPRECFAEALRATEPIAADARPGRDGRANAKLKLIAGILGIGFDALKQREQHRRVQRMAVTTGLALFAMLITTALSVSAVISRNDARRRQKQGEELVGFMLGDLSDRLTQVSRLDVLESVDDRAMTFFQSLPNSDVTDDTIAQRARALERIGTVRLDQGHLAQAMSSFEASARLSGALANAKPEDAARQLAYSRVLAYLGMADWTEGKLDDAQQQFESAQAALLRSKSQSSGNLDFLYQLTSIDNNVGHVLEARGKLDEASMQYQNMLAHCEELASGHGAKNEWISQLGAAHNNLGKVALMRGDLTQSISEYSADDALETKLSSDDPRNMNQLEDKLRARAILGRTLALAGDIEAGSTDLREALQIATRLTTVDANLAGYQEKVARYSSQLARLKRYSGDVAGANELTQQSLRIYSALTQQDAANATWQQGFAEALIEQASQSWLAGNVVAVRSQIDSALGKLGPLATKKPGDRSILLATLEAKLLLVQPSPDTDTSIRIEAEVLDAIHAVVSGQDDPRLAALRVEVLLDLGRPADANQAIQRLWKSGYRDVGLLALLERKKVAIPDTVPPRQRLASH